MKELYVYYRIDPADAATALPQVERMFNGLRHGHAGLHARLLRRAQPEENQETWMEVYTYPGGITPDLQAAIDAATRDTPGARIGTRHQEVFEPVDPRGSH